MFGKLFSRLFGNDTTTASPAAQPSQAIEFEGYLIYPEPIAEGGQYRLAGRICQQVGDELKTHPFVRADLLSSREGAADLMVSKAKLFIQQNQGQIF